jgi:hypothetical protein
MACSPAPTHLLSWLGNAATFDDPFHGAGFRENHVHALSLRFVPPKLERRRRSLPVHELMNVALCILPGVLAFAMGGAGAFTRTTPAVARRRFGAFTP